MCDLDLGAGLMTCILHLVIHMFVSLNYFEQIKSYGQNKKNYKGMKRWRLIHITSIFWQAYKIYFKSLSIWHFLLLLSTTESSNVSVKPSTNKITRLFADGWFYFDPVWLIQCISHHQVGIYALASCFIIQEEFLQPGWKVNKMLFCFSLSSAVAVQISAHGKIQT